jgi:2,4-dienoyl-CoA reductase-like NADH-dependent reductase (Old Yellow Enzyme family)
MTSLHDPLHLPCGLVLPNRIMKASMSEALAHECTFKSKGKK